MIPPDLGVPPGSYDRDALRGVLGEVLYGPGHSLPVSTFYDWLVVCCVTAADWYQAGGEGLSDVQVLLWYAHWRKAGGQSKSFRKTLLRYMQDEPHPSDRPITVQATAV